MSLIKSKSTRALALSAFVTLATIFAFQNCAQPNQIDMTNASSQGGFTATYTPVNVTPSTMITINASGGVAPYTFNKIQGAGTLSSNVYLTPNGYDYAEIDVVDAGGNHKTVTFNVNIGAGSQAFITSGSFTVPVGVTSIAVKAWGAGGGGGGSDGAVIGGHGGGGSYATGNITVTPGESLNITVGAGGMRGLANATGAGGGAVSGGGGGAGGSSGTSGTAGGGGAGGGGSFVYRGTSLLLAAGGGGGGGGAGSASAAGLGDGGAGEVNGSSVANGGTGGVKGASATTSGTKGANRGATTGGGAGGGGGGFKGGGGGTCTAANPAANRSGGGGGGGISLAPTITMGAGVQPGNAADPDRMGAGTGGSSIATTSTDGQAGRVIISW